MNRPNLLLHLQIYMEQRWAFRGLSVAVFLFHLFKLLTEFMAKLGTRIRKLANKKRLRTVSSIFMNLYDIHMYM